MFNHRNQVQHPWRILTILGFCKPCNLPCPAAPALLWLFEMLQIQHGGASVILVLSCLLGPFSLLNIFHSSSFSFQLIAKALAYPQCMASSPIPWNFNLAPFIFTVTHFFPIQPQLSCVLLLLSNFVSAAHFISTLTSCAKVINKNI